MRQFCLLLFAAVCVTPCVAAQHQAHEQHATRVSRDSVSVMATLLVTRATPALAGRARTEALVTQPMLMARGGRANGALRYTVMLNAEHWSMPEGEPVAGIWGEGFVDRRHPHTVLHEVMVTGVRQVIGRAMSLSVGRGIVPFGTDDPMVRPFTKYPANHHYAQLLERLVIGGAVRLSPRSSLELAAFNGDEPASPTAAPQWSRFGDSYAGRLTVWPTTALEVQGSTAAVRSPEFVSGQGFDQRKWSLSSRWTPKATGVRYLLAEWARTEERYRDRPVAGYGTGLIEGLVSRRAFSLALRAERTSRHEEERLLDPFRTARPPSDLTIKGITRWHLFTGQVAAALPAAHRLHAVAFIEATRANARPLLTPVLLDPKDIIGANTAWHATIGVRVGRGAMPLRVGRYGAASGGPSTDVALTMPHH